MKRLIFAALTTLTLCLSSVAAHADDLIFTLTSPLQNSFDIGGILTFEATVSAPLTNVDAVNLNGDSYTLAGALTLDDTGFFTNFPLALAPGETFTGILFTVTVPVGASIGLYNNTFSILGGGVGAQDALATVNFNVSVVPEPSSLFLAAAGALVGLVRFRKHSGGWSRKVAA